MTDIDETNQFRIPDPADPNQSSSEYGASPAPAEAVTQPANSDVSWSEADSDLVAHNLTGRNILETLPHDERRWREAILAEQVPKDRIDPVAAGDYVMDQFKNGRFVEDLPEVIRMQKEENVKTMKRVNEAKAVVLHRRLASNDNGQLPMAA